MSQPSLESASTPTILSKKPQLNIYTVLLIISLIALLMACLFLYLELNEYGGFGAVKGRISAITAPVIDTAQSYWV